MALLSLENLRGRFVFIPKVLGDLFFNNNRIIVDGSFMVLKCELNTTSEHRMKLFSIRN